MVADNAVEGTGSELNAKAGRRALLIGVPCRTATGPVHPATGENVILSNIEEQLWKGLKGDFSGQINETNVDESWKPLVKAVNDVNRKMEEESTEIRRLRRIEDASNSKESLLTELSVIKESVFIKNPMPLLLLDPVQQIHDVNEAFCRVSGFGPEELKGMNYQDLKIVTTRGNGVQDVLKFKRHNVSDLIIDFPSGAHAFEQYSIPMITDSGSLSGIMVVFYDKTASLQEEEQMKSEIQELKLLLEEESKKKDHSPQLTGIPVIPNKVVPAAEPGITVVSTVPEDKQLNAKTDAKKSLTFDVVEFDLCGEKYALDINLAREIVEMMPITPIPCSPDYLRGIMNLRGEITNIINITAILGLPARDENSGSKIIVLSAEATGGENIGVIVDDVQSVIQINERDVEHLGEGLSSQSSMHIKGIIKIGSRGLDKKSEADEKDLVIWLDMLKVIEDLSLQKSK